MFENGRKKNRLQIPVHGHFFFYIYTHIKDLKTIPNVGDFSPNLATLSKLDAGFEFHFVLNFKNQSKTFCPTLMVCQFCPKITPPPVARFWNVPLSAVQGQRSKKLKGRIIVHYVHTQTISEQLCVHAELLKGKDFLMRLGEKHGASHTHTHRV